MLIVLNAFGSRNTAPDPDPLRGMAFVVWQPVSSSSCVFAVAVSLDGFHVGRRLSAFGARDKTVDRW